MPRMITEDAPVGFEVITEKFLILDASDCKLLLDELDHHTCKLENYKPFHDLLKLMYEVVDGKG